MEYIHLEVLAGLQQSASFRGMRMVQQAGRSHGVTAFNDSREVSEVGLVGHV